MTSLSKHTEQSRLPFLLVPDEVEEEEEEEAEESQGTPGRCGPGRDAMLLEYPGKLRGPPPGSLRTLRASGCSEGLPAWLWRGGDCLGWGVPPLALLWLGGNIPVALVEALAG